MGQDAWSRVRRPERLCPLVWTNLLADVGTWSASTAELSKAFLEDIQKRAHLQISLLQLDVREVYFSLSFYMLMASLQVHRGVATVVYMDYRRSRSCFDRLTISFRNEVGTDVEGIRKSPPPRYFRAKFFNE